MQWSSAINDVKDSIEKDFPKKPRNVETANKNLEKWQAYFDQNILPHQERFDIAINNLSDFNRAEFYPGEQDYDRRLEDLRTCRLKAMENKKLMILLLQKLQVWWWEWNDKQKAIKKICTNCEHHLQYMNEWIDNDLDTEKLGFVYDESAYTAYEECRKHYVTNIEPFQGDFDRGLTKMQILNQQQFNPTDDEYEEHVQNISFWQRKAQLIRNKQAALLSKLEAIALKLKFKKVESNKTQSKFVGHKINLYL